MKAEHVHGAKHVSRASGGTVYEVCECGAVKVTRSGGYAEPWHVCELCCGVWNFNRG